jgi:hypothetical protein
MFANTPEKEIDETEAQLRQKIKAFLALVSVWNIIESLL